MCDLIKSDLSILSSLQPLCIQVSCKTQIYIESFLLSKKFLPSSQSKGVGTAVDYHQNDPSKKPRISNPDILIPTSFNMAAPASVTLRNLSGKYALVSENPLQKRVVLSTTMRIDPQAQRGRDM